VTASRLRSTQVERLWGRRELPQAFGVGEGRDPIGEIWFEDGRGDEAELLVKYLLTRERLSIQVHPDSASARLQGLPRGKDEAWLVIEAEPGARIGLGLTGKAGKEALRQAAESGAIEALVDWREARPGDFFYAPAGTIHALGPGLTLVEIQQNCDCTWRFYDYGRARELQVEAAVAAARPEPWSPPSPPRIHSPGREILAEDAAFVVERWTRPAGGRLAGKAERPVWIVPVLGGGLIDGQALEPPSVWLVGDQSRVRIEEGSQILFAYPGSEVIEDLFVDTRRGAESAPAADRRIYRPPVRLEPKFR
jgi:mannose-6-phosphate isomerase